MRSNIRFKSGFSNKINPRNRLSLVRKNEIRNENPWPFEPRVKGDSFWPKRAISGSSIYPDARKFLKMCWYSSYMVFLRRNWYKYVRVQPQTLKHAYTCMYLGFLGSI